MRLDFVYFNTEYTHDPVKLYDGPDISSPVMDTLSGYYTKPRRGYTTTQQYMYVTFTSDALVTYKGFKAQYSSTNTS